MSPRPDVSEERRNQILNAATAVFARLGFSKARMDDIVEQAGLSKGALYWYFKSKDEIVTALLARLFDPELARLRELPETGEPVADQLLAWMDSVAADVRRFSAVVPLSYEFYSLALRHKGVKDYFRQFYAEYRRLVGGLLDRGIEREELCPVDTNVTATVLGAIIDGAVLAWMMDPETVDLGRTLHLGAQLVLDGLKVGG